MHNDKIVIIRLQQASISLSFVWKHLWEDPGLASENSEYQTAFDIQGIENKGRSQ
jgi:hypothetical protein